MTVAFRPNCFCFFKPALKSWYLTVSKSFRAAMFLLLRSGFYLSIQRPNWWLAAEMVVILSPRSNAGALFKWTRDSLTKALLSWLLRVAGWLALWRILMLPDFLRPSSVRLDTTRWAPFQIILDSSQVVKHDEWQRVSSQLLFEHHGKCCQYLHICI